MSLRYIFAFLLLPVLSAAAQTNQDAGQNPQIKEQPVLNAEEASRQKNLNRMRALSQRNQSRVYVVGKDGVSIKSKPALTAADIRAIEISEEDLRQYGEFLRQPKTGIIRLHDAEICLPNRNLIQAESPCPNNVSGKATGFSFRRDDYSVAALSDVFFSKNSFSAPGMFTIGIFSKLGKNAGIEAQSLASDGVKQLVELIAPETADEAEELLYLIKTGAVVGGKVYKSSADIKINETYVLRSIAYRGKALRENGNGFKVNVLDSDERADVLIVFRPIRKYEDGSVALIWKEVAHKPAPKIVLTEIEQRSK